MKLLGNLYLEADANQYTVKEIKTVKKMNFKTKEVTDEDIEKVSDVGYYSTLEAALKGAINYEIRNGVASGELNHFDMVVQRIEQLGKMISDMCKGA